jgi:hypothetical protein
MTPFITSAQTSVQGISAENTTTKAIPSSDTRRNVSAYRKAFKKLPALYNGYVIELEASNYPLDHANAIFRQFGNVYYDKLTGGGYSYCIKVDFSSLDSVKQYLNNNIIYRAPEARILQYKKGKRLLVD